jgi:hypothetical protein
MNCHSWLFYCFRIYLKFFNDSSSADVRQALEESAAARMPIGALKNFFYQNAEYNATSMATMINAPTANEVDTLNILGSISSPLGTIPFLLS